MIVDCCSISTLNHMIASSSALLVQPAEVRQPTNHGDGSENDRQELLSERQQAQSAPDEEAQCQRIAGNCHPEEPD